MDLTSIPVIDTHAHPFPPSQGEVSWQQFRDAASVSLRANASADNDSTLLMRMLTKELSALLGTSRDQEELWEARNALAKNPTQYHQKLWDHANIKAVLIDCGFPLDNLIEAEDWAAVVPGDVYQGYRIERFAHGGTPEKVYDYDSFASFTEFLEAFDQRLDEESKRPDFRFYKSIIAYRTGLRLTIPSADDAAAAWKDAPAVGDSGEKVLRDFLFHRTALKALELDVPFQVHTGHTSHAQPWPNANPIEMTLMLNAPQMDDVRFVLVHGGYPFNTEAGYITSVYPNVFLDLSLMVPWSSIGIARRIEETLEAAPTSKVMYGSDGIMIPELFWISAINTRRALGKVLDNLTSDGVLDEDESFEIANDILYRTAERVYRVKAGV